MKLRMTIMVVVMVVIMVVGGCANGGHYRYVNGVRQPDGNYYGNQQTPLAYPPGQEPINVQSSQNNTRHIPPIMWALQGIPEEDVVVDNEDIRGYNETRIILGGHGIVNHWGETRNRVYKRSSVGTHRSHANFGHSYRFGW